MDTQLTSPTALSKPWQTVLTAFNLRRVCTTVGLAITIAVCLSPIFEIPFLELLGRTFFIAMMMLLAFNVAGVWRPSWLPRWLWQVIAVATTAPLATLGVYLLALSGDISAFLGNENRIMGFVFLSGSGLIIGLLSALGALYRERDAEVRTKLLQLTLEREVLERQAIDARLAVLQAQIQPHFLFNTLANIQELMESGSPRAIPVFRSLIAYLRASMPQLSQNVATLASEEVLVRSYLELMQMRMPDRLSFRIDIPADLRPLRFPAMILLTLVENAVRHGIDPGEEGGDIEIGARREGDLICVWVADTGVGMNETAVPGTGLSNLQQRLAAFYGSGAKLELTEQAPHGLRAELWFSALI